MAASIVSSVLFLIFFGQICFFFDRYSLQRFNLHLFNKTSDVYTTVYTVYSKSSGTGLTENNEHKW